MLGQPLISQRLQAYTWPVYSRQTGSVLPAILLLPGRYVELNTPVAPLVGAVASTCHCDCYHFHEACSCCWLQLSVMQSHDDGSDGPMGHQMLQLAKLVSYEKSFRVP